MRSANLLARIRKLETRFNDNTGLVPHSEEWFAYWENIIARYIAGEIDKWTKVVAFAGIKVN